LAELFTLSMFVVLSSGRFDLLL